MFTFKIVILGMELTEYGGMSIPPNMQDQGIYYDLVIWHNLIVCANYKYIHYSFGFFMVEKF